MNSSSLKARTRGGFTLIELMVVIGILVILISILLPVLNAARKSAQGADTRNQLRGIATAIDRYYQEQAAYPGVFSNTLIAAGRPATGSPGPLSSTENCVLAMVGGITTNWVSGSPVTDLNAFTYSVSNLGKGPLTFNSLSQKRFNPYVEITPKLFSITGSVLDPITNFGSSEPAVGANTGVPEFIDCYPQAMPIIYLRAKVSATKVVGVDGTPAGSTYQYDARDMLPYAAYKKGGTPNYFAFDTSVFPANASNDQGNPGGNYPTSGGSTYPNVSFVGSYNYFLNSSVGSANQKDAYMLISAGPDRKYGTSDDICNFTN